MVKALVAYFSASVVTKKLAENLAKDAHVFAGKRFAANASSDELKTWAEEYL